MNEVSPLDWTVDKEGVSKIMGGALEDCFLLAADELNCPLTRAALYEAETGINAAFSVRDALAVAQRSGLLAWFGRAKLSELDEMFLPAILILNKDRAVVVTQLLDDNQAVVIDPFLGNVEGAIDRSVLENAYSGYALILRNDYQADLSRPTGRQRGHWFWGTLGRSRWIYIQVVLAAVVSNLLGVVSSIFTMVVYDRILPNQAVESLFALTAGVGIALLFDLLIKLLRASFVDRAGKTADKIMGKRIFDQLLDLKMRAKKGSTGAIANVLREFESVRDFFTSATLIAVVDLPFIMLYIGVVYLVGGPLALVPTLAVPIVLLIGIGVQPALARLAENNSYAGQSKQTVLVETVAGLETIKSVGAGRLMRARWDDAVSRQSEHGQKSRGISQFALNATVFTQQVAQVMIVFYGVFLVKDGIVSMGALIASVSFANHPGHGRTG